MGLVHRVLASADVVPAALDLAGDIVDNVAPMSASYTKQLLWQATEQPLARAWSRERKLFARCAAHPTRSKGSARSSRSARPCWTGRPNVDPP